MEPPLFSVTIHHIHILQYVRRDFTSAKLLLHLYNIRDFGCCITETCCTSNIESLYAQFSRRCPEILTQVIRRVRLVAASVALYSFQHSVSFLASYYCHSCNHFAGRVLAVVVCLSVCLSQVGVLLKR